MIGHLETWNITWTLNYLLGSLTVFAFTTVATWFFWIWQCSPGSRYTTKPGGIAREINRHCMCVHFRIIASSLLIFRNLNSSHFDLFQALWMDLQNRWKLCWLPKRPPLQSSQDAASITPRKLLAPWPSKGRSARPHFCGWKKLNGQKDASISHNSFQRHTATWFSKHFETNSWGFQTVGRITYNQHQTNLNDMAWYMSTCRILDIETTLGDVKENYSMMTLHHHNHHIHWLVNSFSFLYHQFKHPPNIWQVFNW